MNYSIKNTGILKEDIAKMGYNVLTDKTPTLRDASGREFAPLWDKDIDFVTMRTINQHIDFRAEMPFTVTYDMGEEISFESALLASYYTANANYCLEDFKIYCADNESELYSDDNIIGEYNNEGVYNKQNNDGSIVKFDFDAPHKARFFGLKVFKTNPTDNIARIAKIAVFSKAYEKERTYIYMYGSAVSRDLPIEFIDETGKSCCIWPEYGLLSYLNDGVALNSQKSVALRFTRPINAVFRFSKISEIDKVVIVHKGELPKIELYASDDIKELYSRKLDYTLTRVNM